MEVKQFAVSVQWGKGMHHFVATDLSNQADAEQLAAVTLKTRLRMKSLHAKPAVHVWHIVSSIKE